MGMLTGSKIIEEARAGRIFLGNDIRDDYAGPNSYDIEIGDTFGIYRDDFLDMDSKNEVEIAPIPDSGLLIMPGYLYLIPSRYKIGSTHYIPLLTGRSSIGRLGVSIHQEAGFGDIGFVGVWTMQISSIFPTRIYKHRRLAQMYFITPVGDVLNLYHGKYNHGDGLQGSKSYMDVRHPELKHSWESVPDINGPF